MTKATHFSNCPTISYCGIYLGGRIERQLRRGLTSCLLVQCDVGGQFLLLGSQRGGRVLALGALNLQLQHRSGQLEDLVLDLAVLFDTK